MLTLAELTSTFSGNGRLAWIGIRPGRREPMIELQSAAISFIGLEGDRVSRASDRSVTIIQEEHVAVIASLIHARNVGPLLLRRNLVIGGINLAALKDRRFLVGGVILEGSGVCAPCSRMEQALGPGGYNAMRGHGGITARVIQPGTIHVGDDVVPYAGETT
jgi:MOSC domain-containing protein YiiM